MRFCITLPYMDVMTMTTLSVTTRGQVTFRKDILKHLGIQPGGKIRLDLLPDGRAELKADQPKGSWRALHGMLKGKGDGPRFTIEEINDAIAEAGAAAGVAGLPAEFDNKLSETSPSGRATVTYELSEDARVYGSVGRGFRAGGFDGSTIWSTPEADAFKSESVWAYEGGVKFMPARGPVQFEVAGFYYDFSNIQAGSFRTYDGATTSVRTNVGKARRYGGEASFTIRPVRPMTINFGVALLDTKVTAIEAITAAEKARLGNDLPFAPNMTLNGSIRYEFALNDRMTLTPQVDARYVDAYYGDLDNTAPVGDFALVNARIDLKIDQRWTVAGFVRNIADVDYTTGGSATQAFSGTPRTWGVSLGARF